MFAPETVLASRYRLESPLGKTAAGRETWLATTVPDAHPVVIKLLAIAPTLDWQTFELFEREAKILKALDLPHIPRYYDFFEVDPDSGQGLRWWALVQEWIAGDSLQACLDRGDRFTLWQVQAIAHAVLAILDQLHRLSPPVLHRDIKPSNLIWVPPGSSASPDSLSDSLSDSPSEPALEPASAPALGDIYLVDFGAVQDQAAVTGMTFTVVGTSGYAPLEQFWGRAVPGSDLYALGATLIHLLTGVAPAQLPHADARLQFRDRLALPEGFADWLETLTDPAVERRFGSARAAIAALTTAQTWGDRPIQQPRWHPKPRIQASASQQVRIQRSPDHLSIRCLPGSGWRFLQRFSPLALGCLSLILIAWFGVSALFWSWHGLIGLGAIALILGVISSPTWQQLGGVTIDLTPEKLWLKRHVLGHEFTVERTHLGYCQGVFVQKVGSTYDLIFRIGAVNVPLVMRLTADESVWVVREIESWLATVHPP